MEKYIYKKVTEVIKFKDCLLGKDVEFVINGHKIKGFVNSIWNENMNIEVLDDDNTEWNFSQHDLKEIQFKVLENG